MKTIEAAVIWCAGYKPANVANEHPEDREQLGSIGGTVLFSALVAALNWGVAGWTFVNIGGDARWLAAFACAFVGIALVLVIDRSFIFTFDTSEIGRLNKFIFSALRLGVVLAVGSITAQAVMPILLKSELSVHALAMRERDAESRYAKLTLQHQTKEKEAALSTIIGEINQLEVALSTIPQSIKIDSANAKQCFNEYRVKKQALLRLGLTVKTANERLSTKRGICSVKQKSADTRLNAYMTNIQGQLDQERANKKQLDNALLEANQLVETKARNAQQIVDSGLNEASSDVLYDLLRSQPGALGKWFSISILIVFLELFPLLQKLFLGRSSIGMRYLNDAALRKAKQVAKFSQEEHQHQLSTAIAFSSQKAVEAALASPEIRKQFSEKFSLYLSALAPLEAARAMMETLSEYNDQAEFIRRYPQFAAIVSSAWSQALKDVSKILQNENLTKSTQSFNLI
jgi:Domain of unknown function (DUF4407)